MRVDLSSLEFEDRASMEIKIAGMDRITKRILRAMGQRHTGHTPSPGWSAPLIGPCCRPHSALSARTFADAEAYHRWIIARRYQVGFVASQCLKHASGVVWG